MDISPLPCPPERRIQLLHSVRRTRLDIEGIEDVDVEISAAAKWKRWRKNLSFDEDQKLRLYRGGCGPSETRRGAVRSRIAGNSTSRADYDGFVCPWCGAPAASVRHMWAECPNFQDLREELQVLHNIPEAWWSAQPRVTAKSGWVTVGAHPDPRRRVTLQIAACHLGIQVLEAYFHKTKFTSGCRGMDVDFDAPRPADAHLR